MEALQDFVELLTNSGVPEIAEQILGYLDYKDLKNAELVCKLWHDVIRNGRNWKRCLEKMLCNPTLKKLYSRYINEPSTHQRINVQIKDHIYFKAACHTVMRYHQRLLYNWMSGAQQEELSEGINVFGRKVSFDMNSRYIVIGQMDGKILVRNREDATLEHRHTPEFKLEGSQSEIRCMQLNENNLLVCGGRRGVITFWDVHLGKFLKRFTANETYNTDHLRFGNDLLITGSNSQETHQSRLTIWDIRNISQISHKDEIVFLEQSIFGLGMDERFIVLLVGKESIFEVQVRLTQDPLILVHSMIFRSHAFCGFHYEDGFVAAGSYDGKIRIWDAETGNCKRILLRPSYDSGPIRLRFNSRFLVTNNAQGISIWNFKEAVSNFLSPYTKLLYCSFQTRSGSQPEQWSFLMDDFEIIRFEHSLITDLLPDLPGRHRGKSFVVRHHFLSQWFY
ncbi:F-box and WD repeat domain-containing 11-B-like [Daphnia pulex]|uniref:F-box and WD repeat domain-containing 11-B-like n=1 Tax=Daphnia pulex TaxID=6669 RepID=UPI001EDF88D3|nr:F-box and WD repeat domain-containing 11-B-like [Daphnia pulex]